MGLFRSRDRAGALIAKAPDVFGAFTPDRSHLDSTLLPYLAELRIAFETGVFGSRDQPGELVKPIQALPSEKAALCAWAILKSSGAAYAAAGPYGEYFASLVAICGAISARQAIQDAQRSSNTATLKRFEKVLDVYWNFYTPGPYRDLEQARSVYVRAAIRRTLGGDSASFDRGIDEAVRLLDRITADGASTGADRTTLMTNIASTRADYLSQKGR